MLILVKSLILRRDILFILINFVIVAFAILEAVALMCSVKKVFLEISQNS